MNKIRTRKQLKFFIKADYMMNRGYFSPPLKKRIMGLIYPDDIMNYLTTLRNVNYYSNSKGGVFHNITKIYYKVRLKRLGQKLGFSIGSQASLGYGLVIPHWGTIVVGDSNQIGNYCVLHTSTCISDNGKIIGDGLYVATGAKITAPVKLGNGVSIAANSVVTKSFEENNILLGGMPAEKKRDDYDIWYQRDGESFMSRVKEIELLKIKINL